MIADAIYAVGGTVHEVRVQFWRVFREKRIRVVVELPDATAHVVLAGVLQRAGATIEPNPVHLGMGVRCPVGHVVTFSVPYTGELHDALEIGPGPV